MIGYGQQPATKKQQENKRFYENHKEELRERMKKAYHKRVEETKLMKALKLIEEIKGIKLSF